MTHNPGSPAYGKAPSKVTLTPEEEFVYKQLFAAADSETLGVVTGQQAVPFFANAKLPSSKLGEIWQLADEDDQGFLLPHQFNVALKLIALAQSGNTISLANLNRKAPLPKLEGIFVEPYRPELAPPPPTQKPALAITAPPPPSMTPSSSASSSNSMSIPPNDKAKYARLFASCSPVNGELDGEKARGIFLRSKLPVESLGKIWSLVDTHQRGKLNEEEFSAAMYFIERTMNGSLPTLPSTLPPGLIPSSFIPSSSPPSSHRSYPANPMAGGGSVRRSSAVSSFDQAFGQVHHHSPSLSHGFNDPTSWDISNEQQTRFYNLFDRVDKTGKGRIYGDEAVSFFVKSKVPESQLAQIWDLSDVDKDGTLTKEEFAVAMYLIHQVLIGKPLPSTLPLSLVPPGMRSAFQDAHPFGDGKESPGFEDAFDPNFSGLGAPSSSVTQGAGDAKHKEQETQDQRSLMSDPFGLGELDAGAFTASPPIASSVPFHSSSSSSSPPTSHSRAPSTSQPQDLRQAFHTAGLTSASPTNSTSFFGASGPGASSTMPPLRPLNHMGSGDSREGSAKNSPQSTLHASSKDFGSGLGKSHSFSSGQRDGHPGSLMDLFDDPAPPPSSVTTLPSGLPGQSSARVATRSPTPADDPFGLDTEEMTMPMVKPLPPSSTSSPSPKISSTRSGPGEEKGKGHESKVAEIQRLQADLAEQSKAGEKAQAELAEAKKQASELEGQRRDLAIRLAQAKQSLGSAQRERDEVMAVLKEGRSALLEEREEVERAELELAELRREREEAAKARAADRAETADLARRLAVAEEALKPLRAQATEWRREATLQEAQLSAARSQVKQAEQELASGGRSPFDDGSQSSGPPPLGSTSPPPSHGSGNGSRRPAPAPPVGHAKSPSGSMSPSSGLLRTGKEPPKRHTSRDDFDAAFNELDLGGPTTQQAPTSSSSSSLPSSQGAQAFTAHPADPISSSSSSSSRDISKVAPAPTSPSFFDDVFSPEALETATVVGTNGDDKTLGFDDAFGFDEEGDVHSGPSTNPSIAQGGSGISGASGH